MRQFVFAVAVAALVLPGSALAQATDDFGQPIYARAGDWNVRVMKTSHPGCHAYRNSNVGLFGVAYGQSGGAMLSFTLPGTQSRGPSTRELAIFFGGQAGRPDKPWGERPFNLVPMETGATMYFSDILPVAFLDDFAANATIRVYADNKLLATLPLDGAGPAIAKLRECAASVAVPAKP